MPLLKSLNSKAISANIKTEKDAHPDMPLKQAIAIAYNVKTKKKTKR